MVGRLLFKNYWLGQLTGAIPWESWDGLTPFVTDLLNSSKYTSRCWATTMQRELGALIRRGGLRGRPIFANLISS